MPNFKDQKSPLKHAEPPIEPKTAASASEEENSSVPVAESQPEVLSRAVPRVEQELRRSGRITNQPKSLDDYVLYWAYSSIKQLH